MANLIIGTKWVTKVLMDGGSGLNIMYAEMLNAMGIDRSCNRPTRVPFHGIMPGKQVVPLWQIDLPSPSRIRPITGRRPLPLRWSGSTGPTTLS